MNDLDKRLAADEMNNSRQEIFLKLGVSEEVAKIAAKATYLKPKERTPEQKQAVHEVSQKIAQANRGLAKE